ncbi:acylphosphatase [bacterium]|nr:acylphosphatase [bacterium]
MPTRHYIVRGRVQGVGFRWFTRQEALTLGLSGWTRNRRDGSVEVLVNGPSEALEEMDHTIVQGPPTARVDAVDSDGGENADKVPLGFEILPTE